MHTTSIPGPLAPVPPGPPAEASSSSLAADGRDAGLSAPPASAAVAAAPTGIDRVVSASGTIDSSCGSGHPGGTPVNTTIQAAVDALGTTQGQQIYVCAGTYTENVTIGAQQRRPHRSPTGTTPPARSDPAIIQAALPLLPADHLHVARRSPTTACAASPSTAAPTACSPRPATAAAGTIRTRRASSTTCSPTRRWRRSRPGVSTPATSPATRSPRRRAPTASC